MTFPSERLNTLFVCIGLIFACLLGYGQVYHNDFINWDDNEYITENPYVHSGLSLQNIKWAFTTCKQVDWNPVTWISHMLDCELFDLNAGLHHLVNVLLHCASTVLLFWVLKRMTDAVWPSAFVAALFALHPLHVESVAWMAERKDVLSTFFWFLTMLAYDRYVLRPRIAGYLLVLLFFVLGLMSKPMLVTLPFVLLLLDYWPLERFGKVKTGRIILEKLPLFVFSGALSVVTFIVAQGGGVMSDIKSLGFKTRFANAIVSYVAYIGKMFWPSRLAVLYPHPAETIPLIKVVLCGALLLLVTGLFYDFARRKKYLIVGWLWYLGTLVPVIGLVQAGSQAMADRYTYVPLTGLFIIIAWAVPDVLSKYKYRSQMLGAAAISVLLVLLVLTHRQVSLWKNSFTLFTHTLNVTKNNAVMHNNLGNVFLRQTDYGKAEWHYREALRIDPYYVLAHYNLAHLLQIEGRLDEAIRYYLWVVQVKPTDFETRNNLAMALKSKGELDEAVSHLETAIEINSKNSYAHYNIALVLAEQKQIDRAISHLKKALEIKPDFAEARKKLYQLTEQKKQLDRVSNEHQNQPDLQP
jgi:tetratricopeptide (TPR) repeat protein